MFELLPPQQAALVEHGLLDQAKTAIVVDLHRSTAIRRRLRCCLISLASTRSDMKAVTTLLPH